MLTARGFSFEKIASTIIVNMSSIEVTRKAALSDHDACLATVERKAMRPCFVHPAVTVLECVTVLGFFLGLVM
jgi:hypothetical protein